MTLLDVIDLDEIWTVNSVRKEIFLTMGGSRRGFGLEFMRISRLIFFLLNENY